MKRRKVMTTIQVLKPHVALNVRNVQESIAFYRKLFGIEPSKVRSGYAKFDVQNPALNLAMNEAPAHEPHSKLSHLGIQVASTEDVLAVKAQWEAAGLSTRDEMQTSCCYAVQDKTWVSDPDGNQWEVFVVLEDHLPQTGAAQSCCAATPALVQLGK
jgi:catechol 2,3-dioxygenase-like lactoylglutathione lyase family enzyme